MSCHHTLLRKKNALSHSTLEASIYAVVLALLVTAHCHASSVTPSLSTTHSVSDGSASTTRTISQTTSKSWSPTLTFSFSISASATPSFSVLTSFTSSVSSTTSNSASISRTVTPPPTPTPSASATPTITSTTPPTVSASPSLTGTPSMSSSASSSRTATVSNTTTPPPTPTPTVSYSSTVSLTATVSNTTTPPPTPTPTSSASPSVTFTSSPTVSVSPSLSFSQTTSQTPTVSNTTTPPPTPTPTTSASSTNTETTSYSRSLSTSATKTLPPTVTLTLHSSATATLSLSGTASSTPSPTGTPSLSATRSPSSSTSPSATLSPSDTGTPTSSTSRSPTTSASPSATASSTPSRSLTPSSSNTASQTTSMTLSRSLTPTSSESPSHSSSVTSSYSRSPSATVTLTTTISMSVTSTQSSTVTVTGSATVTSSHTMTSSLSRTTSPSSSTSPSATMSMTSSGSRSPTTTPTLSVTTSGTGTSSRSPTCTVSGTETISLSQTVTLSQSLTSSPSSSASASVTLSMTRTISTSVSETTTPSVSPSHTKSLSLSSSLFEKTPGVGVCYSQQALYADVVFTITVEGKNFADDDRYLFVQNRSECWWRPLSEFQQVFWVSAPRTHAIVRNQLSGFASGFFICYRSNQFDLDFNFSCPQKFFPQQAVAPWVDQQHLRQLASEVVVGGTGLTMDALNALQCVSGYVPTYGVELAYGSGVLTNPVSSTLQFGNFTQRIRIREVCTFLIAQDTPVFTPGSEGVNALNASSAGDLAFLFEADSLLDDSDIVVVWKRLTNNATSSGIAYLPDVPAIDFEGVSPNCPRSFDGYVPVWVVPLGQQSLRMPPGDYLVSACAGIDGRGYSSSLTYTRVPTVCPNDCKEGGGAIRGTCNTTTARCECHYAAYGGADCAQPLNCSLDSRLTSNISASSGSWSMSGARQCGALLEADGSDVAVGGGFGIGLRVTQLTLSSTDCTKAYVELRATSIDGPIIRTLCAVDADSVNSVLSPIHFNASLRVVHVSYVSNNEDDSVNITFVSIGTACPGIADASGFVPPSAVCSGRGVCVDVDFTQLRDFPLSSKKCSCDNPWAAERPGASCETCARGNVQWTFPACVAIPVCEWNCNNRGNCTADGCACFFPYFGRVCELNPTGEHLQASQWLKGRISFDGASGAVQSTVPSFLSCQVSGCKVARRSTGIAYYAGDDSLYVTLADDSRALVQNQRSFFALDAATSAPNTTTTTGGDEGISFNPVKREGAGDYYEQTNVSATPVDVAGESTTTVWARLTRNSNGFLFAKVDSVAYSDGTIPMLDQAFYDVQDRHAPLETLKLRNTNTSLYFAIYVNGNRDRIDIMSVDVDRRDGTDGTSYCDGADSSRCSESDGASGSGRDSWFYSRSFRLNGHYRNILFDGNWHFIAVTVRRGSGRYEGQVYVDGGSIDGNVNFVQCLPFLPNAIANNSFQRAQNAAIGDPSVSRIGPGGSVVIGYGLQGSVDEMRFYVPSLRQVSLVKIAGPDYDGSLTITKDGLVICTALCFATVVGGLVLFCSRREGIRLEGEIRHSGKADDDDALDTSDEEEEEAARPDPEGATKRPYDHENAENPFNPPSSDHDLMASPATAATENPFAFPQSPKRSTSIETVDDDEGLWMLLGLPQTTPDVESAPSASSTKRTPPPADVPTANRPMSQSTWGTLQAKMRSAMLSTAATATDDDASSPKRTEDISHSASETAFGSARWGSFRQGSARQQRESSVVVLPTAHEEEQPHARSSDSFDGDRVLEGAQESRRQSDASRRESVSSFLEDAAAQRRFSTMQMKESQNARSNRKLRSAAVALGNAVTASATGLDGFDSIGTSAFRGLAQGASAAQDVWQYISLHMSGFPWPDLFQYNAGQVISIVSLSFEVSFRISFELSFYVCASVGLAAFAVVLGLFIMDLMKSEATLAHEAAEREAAQLRQLAQGGEAAKLQRSTKEKLVWAALFTLTTLYMPITRNAVIGAFCYRTIQCEFDCYNEARHWRIVYFSAILMLVVTVMVPVILIAVTFRKLRQFAGNRIDETRNDAAVSEDVTLEKDWQQFLAMDNSPYAGAYENFKFRWSYFQSVLILSKALCVFLALGLDTNTSPQLLSITLLHCIMTFLIAASSPFIADVSNLITMIGQLFVVLTLGLNAISRLDPDEDIGVYMGYALIGSSLLCIAIQLALLKRYFSLADLIGGVREMIPCCKKSTSRPGTGRRASSKV